MKYALKIASERKTGKTDSPNALQSIIQGKDDQVWVDSLFFNFKSEKGGVIFL